MINICIENMYVDHMYKRKWKIYKIVIVYM